MSTRGKGYDDYSLSKEKVKELFDYCRSEQADKKIIKDAANSANPMIADLLIESVMLHKSYEKYYGIPYSKVDFYAYRRKFIAELRDRLRAD